MPTFGKKMSIAEALVHFSCTSLSVKENPKKPEQKLVVTTEGKIVAFGSKTIDSNKPMSFVELIDQGKSVWVLHNPNQGKTLFTLKP